MTVSELCSCYVSEFLRSPHIKELKSRVPIVEDDIICFKFDETIECYRKSFNSVYRNRLRGSSYNLSEKQIACESFAYLVFTFWNRYKVVYNFDSDFLNILCDSEDSVISLEAFNDLPYPCFFVELNRNDLIGMFIQVEQFYDEGYGDNLVSISLACVMEVGDTGTSMVYYPVQVTVREGDTFKDVADSFVEFYGEDHEMEESFMTSISEAVKICYYLASKNRVVKKRKIVKEKRVRDVKNHRPVNISYWDVGYRVGADYPNNKKEVTISENSGGFGSMKRPHVRRAHWHHYWVGEGRTKLELRWIAPTYVKGDSDSVVPTGHKVTS